MNLVQELAAAGCRPGRRERSEPLPAAAERPQAELLQAGHRRWLTVRALKVGALSAQGREEGVRAELVHAAGAETRHGVQNDHAAYQVPGGLAEPRGDLQAGSHGTPVHPLEVDGAKGWQASDHLVDHAAQGPDVGAEIREFVPDHLWCHEVRRADIILQDLFEGHRACTLDVRVCQVLRGAEVDQLDVPLGADDGVLGLQVPVHDLRVPEIRHGLNDLA
mmetsp:Transcript_62667/g.141417  ORF Transcript_62667/g.141417 Transcript_62667/m.141417 type:complete len:220 (+) Transcript_62667:140-799(+)